MPSNVASLLADDNDETFTDVSDLLADDEPAGEVNRIDLNAPEPSMADELRKYGITPQNAGRLRDVLGAIGVPGFKIGSGTGKALALGAIRGGTADAAPMISRNTVDRDFRKQATKPYEDAQRDSPIATMVGQGLGGAPLGMLLSRGGVAASAIGGAALGGAQGFLGSQSGKDSANIVDEFSGDNLAGKGKDALVGGGIGAALGAGGALAGKGIGKLLQMFGPKAGAAVASGADDVAARADDFLSQMDDAAPDSVADDVIEPLKPVPEAGPPRNRSFGDMMSDDVTLGAGDEIFAKSPPGAATKKLGIARDPEIEIDTKQTPFRNFLKDEEGAVKIGMSKKDAFRKLMAESGIDDYDAAGKDALFKKWLERSAESSKQGAMARAQKNAAIEDLKKQIEALSARAKPGAGPGPKPEPFEGGHFDEINKAVGGRPVSGGLEAFVRLAKGAKTWEELETVIRKLKTVPGLERLRMPDGIQDQIIDDMFRAQAEAAEAAAKQAPAKDPAFVQGSGDLAEMIGQRQPSKQEIAAMTGKDGKLLPYGNKYKGGPLDAPDQALFDEAMQDPRAVASKLADELRGPKAPAVEAPPPPAAAVEPPPSQPQDPAKDWYETFFPQRASAQRQPMGNAEPIDVPDMPQKIPEPISDELFAAEAAKVNALGGQKFATAPPVMPVTPRPRPAPIEAPGFDASRASLVNPSKPITAPQSAPMVPKGVLPKGGRMVGRILGGRPGAWIGEKIGQRAENAITPEAAAQALAANPAKLQQLAAAGGRMAGAASFILQGMEEAGEAGLRARAFVAASMPSLRELFAPQTDRTEEQDR